MMIRINREIYQWVENIRKVKKKKTSSKWKPVKKDLRSMRERESTPEDENSENERKKDL